MEFSRPPTSSGFGLAVVYDTPLMRWHIQQRYRGKLPVVLARQDYAFALPRNSPLREAIGTSPPRRIKAAAPVPLLRRRRKMTPPGVERGHANRPARSFGRLNMRSTALGPEYAKAAKPEVALYHAALHLSFYPN